MHCEDCDRKERFLLESMIAADKAETALRCYLLTHERFGGVSDMDEYEALRIEQQKTKTSDTERTSVSSNTSGGIHSEAALSRTDLWASTDGCRSNNLRNRRSHSTTGIGVAGQRNRIRAKDAFDVELPQTFPALASERHSWRTVPKARTPIE